MAQGVNTWVVWRRGSSTAVAVVETEAGASARAAIGEARKRAEMGRAPQEMAASTDLAAYRVEGAARGAGRRQEGPGGAKADGDALGREEAQEGAGSAAGACAGAENAREAVIARLQERVRVAEAEAGTPEVRALRASERARLEEGRRADARTIAELEAKLTAEAGARKVWEAERAGWVEGKAVREGQVAGAERRLALAQARLEDVERRHAAETEGLRRRLEEAQARGERWMEDYRAALRVVEEMDRERAEAGHEHDAAQARLRGLEEEAARQAATIAALQAHGTGGSG